MAKEMLINVSEGEECRIALLEDGKLEELYMERASSTSHVGNIYKGKVTNVEASIQAAFVDFGLGRNGFLHISDLLPQYFGRKGEDVTESVGRKMARRDRPPIQRCLRRGDEVIVQIIKEGIGTKGPTLSTYLSIPGRILVMMPGMASKGVSRKIEDEEERRRLRKILDELKPPKDCGFIIRTAGVGKSKADIERDLKFLTRLNDTIQRKIKSSPAPVELYTEGDLVTRSVRDIFTADIETIVVDNADVADKITDFVKMSAPRTKNKVELYEGAVPLFHKYGIEREIEQMYSRHVPLPGGGSLVIDSTEAVVAIDVNSGKFRDHSDAETTAFKTDMEAADEIARQLKLRDLGGVIICDFIDLRYERHRRELEERLHHNLQKDKAKTKVLRMSQFGIIEMTRQRMRPSLKRSVYFDCPHCKGSGLVKTHESMSLDVMRRLRIAAHDQRVARVEIAMCADVAFHMLNNNRAALTTLEQETGKAIDIKADPALAIDEAKMVLFDSRDGLVYLPDLGIAPEATGGRQQHGRGAQPAQRREERRPATRVVQPQKRNDHDEDHDDEDDRDESDRAEISADHRDEDHGEASTGPLARTPDGDDRDFRGDEVGARNDRRDSRGGQQPQGRRGQPQQPRRDDRDSRDKNNRNQPQGRDDRNRPRDDRGGRDQQRGGRPQQPQNRDRQPQPPVDRSRLDRDRVQPPTGARPPVSNDVPDTIDLDAEGQPSSTGVVGGDQQDQFDAQGQDGGGRKRRRRRRGGRGRGGRGNGGSPGGQPALAGSDATADFDAAADDETGHDDVREESREESAMDSVEDREEARDRDRDYDRDHRSGGDDEDNGIAPAPEPMDDAPPAEPEPAELIADEPLAAPPAVEEEPAKVAKPEKAEKPKRRRAAAATTKAAPKAAPKAKAAKTGRKPRGAAAAAAVEDAPVRIPPPPVAAKSARTGSTDRHQLQTDTPVDPEPVRRPKSYRDLDDIPDDFD